MHGPLPQTHRLTTRPARRETSRAAGLLLLLALIVRAQTFSNPVLGYDEQFYLLVGDRMLHGALPFVDIFDRKPIGLFLIYAFTRLLPGDGFLAYKLVALVFLVLTALCVFRLARRMAGPFGALAAAAIFVIWHDFMGGEGGQSPVFYDLFVAIAALCITAAIDRPDRVRPLGCWAMLATGIAMQIKYCVLFEGLYLGLVLSWLGWRAGMKPGAIAGSMLLWAGAALAPTMLVLGVYAALGHGEAFVFTNFLSAFGQGRNPNDVQLRDLAEIAAILAPLLIVLIVGHLRGTLRPAGAVERFVQGWFLLGLAGVLAYWRFNAPHYALPLLLPLATLLAPVFEAPKRRPAVTLALIAMSIVMSQAVLADQVARRGGAHAAQLLTDAARPRAAGCIFVYAGYPALYMLTGSCLPSRWAFPGSLNMGDEASAKAIGTDPAREVQQILDRRPPVIVDEYPRERFGNRATRTVLDRALADRYALTACPRTGRNGRQLVYRLRGSAGAPAAAAACRPFGLPAPDKFSQDKKRHSS